VVRAALAPEIPPKETSIAAAPWRRGGDARSLNIDDRKRNRRKPLTD
jgi:hypothetical protein